MPNLWDQFKESYDPQMVGIGLLAGTGSGDTGASLGQALLMGRQARMQEAADRAAAAAAQRKEKIDLAKSGVYETPEGFGKRDYMNTSTGAVLQQDISPTGQMSINPVYTPPEKPEQPRENYTPVTATKADGTPVVYMVNKYNPKDYYELGGAVQKPGKPGAGGGAPSPAAIQDQKQQNLSRYKTDLEDFISYFPVTDVRTGQPVSPEELAQRGFDRKGMVVGEKGTGLATGALSGLPSLTSTSQDVDALRQKIQSNEFIDNLLNAKAGGASFGSLTEGEAKKLENFRSAIANDKAPPERIISEYVNLVKYIDQEIAPKYAGTPINPPGVGTTAAGVTWRRK